jgi:hypothetical protein
MKPSAFPVACLELGDIVVNLDYLNLLESFGLEDFASIHNLEKNHVVKETQERIVFRIAIRTEDEKRYFYCKYHKARYLGVRGLLSRILFGRRFSQGRMEFQNICDFRLRQLSTVSPVAAGERYLGAFRMESFLITEAFRPFVSLERIIKRSPDYLQGPEGEKRKTLLMEEIARLARHMHRSGFNHRDFNATHVLLWYNDKSDTPKLALFDLQRVDRKGFFRFKWFIKTIAELNYSLPDTLFTAQDRLHLYLSYKEKRGLNLWDRFQLFWIKRKMARIGRHTETMMRKRVERRKRGLPER